MNDEARESSERNLRTLLQEARPRLRPAEGRIAAFLLTEGAAYSDFTLRQLSRLGGASEAAVVRMCKVLGLGGFRAFRLRWVQEAAGRAARRVGVSSGLAGVYAALDETQPLLAESLADAATVIAESERVYVYGSGGSGLVAELAATELTSTGRLAVAFRADLGGANALSYIEASSAILVISHRGENPRLERVLKRAAQVGAGSVVVTSGVGSTLASLADIVLLTSAAHPATPDMVTLDGRVVQLAAAHALSRAVAEQVAGGERPTLKTEGRSS